MKFSDYISRLKGDRKVWMIIIVMSLISILVVYSSTGALAFRRANGDTTKYILRQMLFQLGGLYLMLNMIKYIGTNFYNKYANLAILSAMGCVVIGILIGRGSGRTIPLGLFSFQPAELVKVAVIMWVARILARTADSNEARSHAFFKIMGVMGILAILLIKVNFSSAVLVFGVAFVMMFVAQIHLKYLLGFVLLVILLFTSMFLIRKSLPEMIYNGSRLETVFNRVDRYITKADPKEDEGITQDEFAKIAIFKGGVLGVGAGKGDISNRMSAAYNDFVFAIIVEEYGLVGAVVIVLLYLVLLTRGLLIVKTCKRSYPLYLATGAVTMILLQALVNMGVSSGAIPVTGQPLPWISLGGTSQLFTALIFGFILSVSAENQSELLKQEDAEVEKMEEFSEEDFEFNIEK